MVETDSLAFAMSPPVAIQTENDDKRQLLDHHTVLVTPPRALPRPPGGRGSACSVPTGRTDTRRPAPLCAEADSVRMVCAELAG